MDKIIASKDFTLNDVDYLKDEVVVVKTYEEVVKLNEFGLIKPLTHKELVLIKRELENKEVENEL